VESLRPVGSQRAGFAISVHAKLLAVGTLLAALRARDSLFRPVVNVIKLLFSSNIAKGAKNAGLFVSNRPLQSGLIIWSKAGAYPSAAPFQALTSRVGSLAAYSQNF
jgi:hypothetical protein